MKSQKRFREICSRVFNGIRLKKKKYGSIEYLSSGIVHKIFWDRRGFLLSVSIIPFAVVLAKIGQITRVKVQARKIRLAR